MQWGRWSPYLDDWFVVPALTHRQPVTLSWLWSQHAEASAAIATRTLRFLANMWDTDSPLERAVVARGIDLLREAGIGRFEQHRSAVRRAEHQVGRQEGPAVVDAHEQGLDGAPVGRSAAPW